MNAARILAGTALLVLLYACAGGSGAKGAGHTPAPVPVVTATVEMRAVPVTLRAVGTIESVATVDVQPRVDGQIVKVLVRDGQEVRAGQALLEIDPAPFEIELRRVRATLARDEATRDNARTRLERGRALVAQHFISADDLRQLETDYEGARATAEADRAAVDSAALDLSYATIVAPVSGKLGHIGQQAGNMAHAAQPAPITTLAVLDTVDVSFAIPAQQLDLVRSAMHKAAPEVQITRTTDGGTGTVLKGKLSFVDNAADPSTGTIRLRARFDNRRRAVWPGQFVAVALVLPAGTEAPTIPSSAVAQGPNGSYVYVIADGRTAMLRAIEVHRTTESLAIVAGVKAGEQVVVDGQSRLSPNAAVTVLTARPQP